MIQEKFPVPLLGIPLFDHEPEGLNDIRALSNNVFERVDKLTKPEHRCSVVIDSIKSGFNFAIMS